MGLIISRSGLTYTLVLFDVSELMTLDEMISLLMLDIIIRKNSGPRTVPWGTPLRTGLF